MSEIHIETINKEILKALGLEGQRVTEVKFRFAVNSLPTVKIRLLINDEQAKKVREVVERYELKEKTR